MLDEEIAALLDIQGGAAVGDPIEVEIFAIPYFVFDKVPEAISILVHAHCVQAVFIWVVLEGVAKSLLLRHRILIHNLDIPQTKIGIIFLIRVALEVVDSQLPEFVVNGLVNTPPLVDLRLALFDSVDVLFVVFNFCEVLPEGVGVLLYLIDGFVMQFTVKIKIIAAIKLAHFYEVEEVTLVPAWEAFSDKMLEQLTVFFGVLGWRLLAILGPLLRIPLVLIPQILLRLKLIKLRIVKKLMIKSSVHLLLPAALRLLLLCWVLLRLSYWLDVWDLRSPFSLIQNIEAGREQTIGGGGCFAVLVWVGCVVELKLFVLARILINFVDE